MLTEQTDFSVEELAHSASINYQAFMLGSIAYLKEKNLPVEEWSNFLAEIFASYWPAFASTFGAFELAKTTGLILVAGGGRLTLLEGNQHSSRVVVEDFPETENMTRFEVSVEDLDLMLGVIFSKIASRLNRKLRYHREGNCFEFSYTN
ncbi:MAG TPA: hypothetical protein VH186_36575 [Chloroflexia bacterium]|nr:hypothetical protein [Chloroflexia bacterium]